MFDLMAKENLHKRKWEGDLYSQQESSSFEVTSSAFSCEDYTVGWICALPLEMTAAKAMLDVVHSDIKSLHPNDHNAYTLGSICGHNVVIACLPSGVYGTTSAARVANQMQFSFPSICVPLMVGIGGGVPSKQHDIRLGDVIVGVPTSESAAITQYDLGKTGSGGKLERKGTLNKPATALLTAVSKLRADDGLGLSKISTILSRTFGKHGALRENFAHPGQDHDVLHESECYHVTKDRSVDTYNLSQCTRQIRNDDNPRVHYGPIASGNQVIKDAGTRDRLARELNCLCLEMEAAGLMDDFPCLVIRGICDYCDSQKQKHFQNYAALAAAAYAVELLSIIPARAITSTPLSQVVASNATAEHRKRVMNSLRVDDIENRQEAIEDAYPDTCEWLLQQSEYKDWLDECKLNTTHGLLWIKGKPGTGKSTLMKFTMNHIEKTMSGKRVIISFFFNARGGELEKSIIGTYRSFLFQLVSQLSRLQHILDPLDPPASSGGWRIEVLRKSFCKAVKTVDQERLFCFVDALDECPEGQARDLVEVLEDLCYTASSYGIKLYVCFSSRHYPHISVDIGMQLILDTHRGHSNDILTYISTKLKTDRSKRRSKLINEIHTKASGIFLWAALVVPILNREYDRGRIHAMQKRLQELPTGLDELFKELLLRDGEYTQELVLCFQWILYAKRPLACDEFYFAMLSGLDPRALTSWNTDHVNHDDMERYVTGSSRGLVEVAKDRSRTVQFIHQSVREFLLRTEVLVALWPGFHTIAKGLAHHELRTCCYNYIHFAISRNHIEMPPLPLSLKDPKSIPLHTAATVTKKLPFLQYAVRYVLHHADTAGAGGVAQKDFLGIFTFNQWLHLYNEFAFLKRSPQGCKAFSHSRLRFPDCLGGRASF